MVQRSKLVVAFVAATVTGSVLFVGPARAVVTTKFTASADTFVSSSKPTRSFGSATALEVDGDPIKQGFVRFDVSGITGTVTSARLRMFQVDSASIGGRVFTTSSGWSEAMTWRSRPTIDGAHVGNFGAVKAGNWYELDVTSVVTADGTVSFAIDSTSSNGSDWASSEAVNPPTLVVETSDVVEPAPQTRLTEVAGPTQGSSDPTNFNSNHRLAITKGGRLLTVYGLHARGVQLEWMDPGGVWRSSTTGAISDGVLHDNGTTGDRPASIATVMDQHGNEHAWVVWSGENTWSGAPVIMRHLSDLDSPSGPAVGPAVIVDTPAFYAYKADLGFEQQPDGSYRGVLSWSRKAWDTSFEVVTSSFGNVSSDIPNISAQKVLLTSTSSGRFGTVVPTATGARVVARAGSGRLQVFGHDSGTDPTSWWTAPAAAFTTDGSATPAGATLDGGDLLVAVESDAASGTIVVQRFTAQGAPSTRELTLSGYHHPTLATGGTVVVLVMVRADGVVVSRALDPGTGWSSTDRVEIEGVAGVEFPNASRIIGGKLRFVTRGVPASTTRSQVLAFERPI